MKETLDFLVEIGCEEIPAGMLPGAATELKVILDKYFGAFNLNTSSPVITNGAPRRLVALCTAVRSRQPDEVKDVTGPPTSVAFDNVGKPTLAAESFAQKMGLPVAKLTVVTTPKGDRLAARQVIPGRLAKDILEEILPRAVKEISWPRTMYWTGPKGLHFIRPIRWVVAMLDGKPLRVIFDGVPGGRFSAGHRFLGKSK